MKKKMKENKLAESLRNICYPLFRFLIAAYERHAGGGTLLFITGAVPKRSAEAFQEETEGLLIGGRPRGRRLAGAVFHIGVGPCPV
ncbi:hypothetical protein EYF80_014881 [Liparis tanakae]|uniref:Uncharacterized protein n=1 Tax=Liparis tanakae TaxID=230148 RepID=A0A4Z2IAJ4_9TELE|nr:hypothetical protein EYF80_014881 [Liparis tanakae]